MINFSGTTLTKTLKDLKQGLWLQFILAILLKACPEIDAHFNLGFSIGYAQECNLAALVLFASFIYHYPYYKRVELQVKRLELRENAQTQTTK